jgi:hypothetical protein
MADPIPGSLVEPARSAGLVTAIRQGDLDVVTALVRDDPALASTRIA